MKKHLKFISLFLILAMGIIAAAGCSPGEDLIVCTAPNFPPFEFPGADGIEGVDIELANAIAKELGRGVKFEEMEFESIIMSMATDGKGDIAIAGFTITDDRKESVDFSDPYIKSYQYLILPEGSEIEFMEDLAGKTIGVALGYTGEFVIDDEIIEGVLEGTNAEMKGYKSAMDATLDIIAGRIDAVVMDEFVAKTIVAQNNGIETKQLKYKDGGLVEEEYGVVVPKDNAKLLSTVNKVIKRLKDDGQIEKWLVEYSEKLASENK